MATLDYLTDSSHWYMVNTEYVSWTSDVEGWTTEHVSWNEVDPPPETEMQKAIREAVEMLK
ncbi:hypothetical protein LCGC14_1807550 [marine sediment metagenome]|uniref:Uncharacterized protein n=1 Tax=marine sediment metagenome TaxID=412755 RepID=A0A0F9GMX4_9ZZZZ